MTCEHYQKACPWTSCKIYHASDRCTLSQRKQASPKSGFDVIAIEYFDELRDEHSKVLVAGALDIGEELLAESMGLVRGSQPGPTQSQ